MVVMLMSMDQTPPPQTPAPAPTPPPVTTPPPAATPPPATSNNMVLAALGYPLGIFALITVLIEKSDREVRFHGWNGLFWNIGILIVMVALTFLMIVLNDVRGIGSLLSLLTWAVRVAWFVASIIFAVNAYNRKPVNIPVISDMARKQVGM